jgi:hypothetical protein
VALDKELKEKDFARIGWLNKETNRDIHIHVYKLRVFPSNIRKAAGASNQSRHWVMCVSRTAQCYWGKWPDVAVQDKTDTRHFAMADVVTGVLHCA